MKRGTGPMYDPPHPGVTLREDVLPALGLTVTEAAAQLGVSHVMLSRVLNERAGISSELAIKLEHWLAAKGDHPGIGGPSAESWLAGQAAYDLWRATAPGRMRVSALRTATMTRTTARRMPSSSRGGQSRRRRRTPIAPEKTSQRGRCAGSGHFDAMADRFLARLGCG